MTTVDDVLAVYRRHLYLDDPGAVWVTLATYVANRRPGTPLWLLVVAPPSSGKTEYLLPLVGAPDVTFVSTISSEGALLSATARKERGKNATGGLLRQIGTFGVLVLKDFGSILSMNRDARAAVMAALREVFDGEWTRTVGSDGGQSLAWAGKVGAIGACTPVIDRAHAVMTALGDRFLLYRPDATATDPMCSRALNRDGLERSMRADLSAAVTDLLAPLDLSANPAHLSPADVVRLTAWAKLVARGRAAVERDRYTREIELVLGAEGPARVAIQLRQLLDGLRTLGADETSAWGLVGKVALDTIPIRRRRLLEHLRSAADPLDTTDLAVLIDHPANTTRRDLEDLTAYKLVQRIPNGPGRADLWRITSWALEVWATAERATFSEMSEDVHTPFNEFRKSQTDISEKVPPAVARPGA